MESKYFRKSGQQDALRMKVCFYGAPGVLKTRTALAFPNPVVIDLEKGTSLYENEFKFDVLRTQNPNVIEDSVDELMEDPGEYRTLVIDPISVYCDLIQETILQQKRIDFQDDNYQLKGMDFGLIKNRIRRFINKLLALDLNIVITAREKPEYQEGAFMKKIGVMPDMHREIPHMIDTLIYVFMDDIDGKIKGVSTPCILPGYGSIVAKDRSRLPVEVFEFNYTTLEQHWGLEGLFRKAEAVTTKQSYVNEYSSRNVDIKLSNGSIIKTAGITAEQIEEIESRVPKDKLDELLTYIKEHYNAGALVDLRADEANLILEKLPNK